MLDQCNLIEQCEQVNYTIECHYLKCFFLLFDWELNKLLQSLSSSAVDNTIEIYIKFDNFLFSYFNSNCKFKWNNGPLDVYVRYTKQNIVRFRIPHVLTCSFILVVINYTYIFACSYFLTFSTKHMQCCYVHCPVIISWKLMLIKTYFHLIWGSLIKWVWLIRLLSQLIYFECYKS